MSDTVYKLPYTGSEIEQKLNKIEDLQSQIDELNKGTDSKDGITPHIGANGNWFLGDTDTGIKAEGKDGYTPVKGVDYFTDEEKAALVSAVLEALPTAEEESF